MARPESANTYTVDIAYPSAFGAYQAPIHMAYAASLGGKRAVPIDGAFRYCDLGCGAGLTLCVLADCYPQAEFHGVDINPTHIAAAQSLAKRAGLANVHFHEGTLSDLSVLKLPSFDFVALSGIYSWLDTETRRQALISIAGLLNKSGLLFLHYSALPGNNQIDALYNMVREIAAGVEGNSLIRFEKAVEVIRKVASADATFFRANPFARAWLDGIGKQDPRSMAHEVLNAQRTSLSVRDVAEEMGPHGLSFVSNAQIEFNHLALVAPAVLENDLAAAPRIAREMLLDTIRNAHSRMDIYASAEGEANFTDSVGFFAIDRLSSGALLDERRKLTAASGVNFLAPIYGDLLAACKPPAGTISQLLKDENLARYQIAETVAALQHLIATKLVHVLCKPYGAAATAGDKVRMSSRLNGMLLEEQIETAGQIPFASPVAGTQLLLPPADRLALLSLVDGDFDSAWKRISTAGQRVNYRGKPVTDPHQLRDVANERAADMAHLLVPKLSSLGVISSRLDRQADE